MPDRGTNKGEKLVTRASKRNLGEKKKTREGQASIGNFQSHLSGGNVSVELQLRNHDNSGGVLQDMCRQGAIPHARHSREGEHVSQDINRKSPQMTLPRWTEAWPWICSSALA